VIEQVVTDQDAARGRSRHPVLGHARAPARARMTIPHLRLQTRPRHPILTPSPTRNPAVDHIVGLDILDRVHTQGPRLAHDLDLDRQADPDRDPGRAPDITDEGGRAVTDIEEDADLIVQRAEVSRIPDPVPDPAPLLVTVTESRQQMRN